MTTKKEAPSKNATGKPKNPAKRSLGKPVGASVTVDEDGNVKLFMPAHVVEAISPDFINIAKQYMARAERQLIGNQQGTPQARVLSPFERMHRDLAELMTTREHAQGEAVAELDRRIELVKADLVAEEEKHAVFFEESQILQASIQALQSDCAALAVELVRTGNEKSVLARMADKRDLLRQMRAKYRALAPPFAQVGHEFALIRGAA